MGSSSRNSLHHSPFSTLFLLIDTEHLNQRKKGKLICFSFFLSRKLEFLNLYIWSAHCNLWANVPPMECSPISGFYQDCIKLTISVAVTVVDYMSAESTDPPLTRLAPRTPITWQQATEPPTMESPGMALMKVYKPLDAFATSWLHSCHLSCPVQPEICLPYRQCSIRCRAWINISVMFTLCLVV